METKLIPYDKVPRELFMEIMHELGDYSVALARITDEKIESFQILGSGTCVRRGDDYGILTAHHVLHGHSRPLSLGVAGADRLIFLTKNGRTVGAAQVELVEQVLAKPEGEYEEYGPDLTFIRIPVGSSLRAICSFWSLDRSPEEVSRMFAIDRACIVNAGYPSFKFDTSIHERQVHANVTLFGGAGALLQEDIIRRGDWDYINSECDYRAFPHLPQSYDGMSGGGIWSAILKSDATGQLRVLRLGLVGVTYWQTGIDDGMRLLRGHFIDSIYRRAWAA